MAKRRAAGEGSLYQRQDGRWCTYVTIGGKRQYHYAHTQRECVAWLGEMRKQVGDGLSADANRITTADYLARWLDVARRSLAPSSADQYAGVLRRHIVPALGKIPLGKLRADHIQVMYSALEDKGIGTETIHVIHAVLHKALAQAVRWRMLTSSPAQGIELPGRRRLRSVVPLTLDQVRVLVTAAHGHSLEALIVLALNTGMRHGELLGLKWPDVDWQAGIIHVQRQYTEYGYVVVKSSKSERALPVGPEALAVLRHHYERQRFAQPDCEVVFAGADGTPLSQDTVRWRFYALLEATGLPRIRVHDLRHTAATLMLVAGVNPKIVQERLGHASIGMTLNTYSHVTPTMQQQAAALLDALLAGKSP